MALVTCPECSAEHGEAATEAAFSDPATLAEWECRWRVEMGIAIYIVRRTTPARRDDPSGPVPGALWNPLAMLRIDP